jgi:helix-turn-helix protein
MAMCDVATLNASLPAGRGPANRFHKECVFGPGRRERRSKRQAATYAEAIKRHTARGKLTVCWAFVLYALPSWFNWKDGRCDPSHETIADKVDLSVKTVQRALAMAKRLGLIGWDQRKVETKGDGTCQVTNQYRILPGLAEPTEAPKVDQPSRERRSIRLKDSESGYSDSPGPLERALAGLARSGGFVLRTRTA